MSDDVNESEITKRRRVRTAPQGERKIKEESLMLAPAEEDNLKLPEEAENDERFVYRWVRVQLSLPQGGYEEDVKNILKREREGWVFVKPEDLPGSYTMPVRATGSAKGVVGVDDVALMKLPREIADARRRWQEKKAADLMQAVNRQLYRENDPRMPIFNESKTAVRVGRNAEFDAS